MKTLAPLAIFLSIVIVTSALAEYRGKTLPHSTTNRFSQYVDNAGNIRVPKNYRNEWVFLGTWSLAAKNGEASNKAGGRGAAGLHNVYTQRSTIKAYRKTGKFPDGAVLVKELLKTKSGSMTTGHASWGSEIEGWFIMVKDSRGRFKDNKLWGDGWGWALFNSDDPTKTVTKDYKTDCISCHIPAKDSDWIYIQGYPVLR